MRAIFALVRRGPTVAACRKLGSHIALLGLVACGPNGSAHQMAEAGHGSQKPIAAASRDSSGDMSAEACVTELEASDIRAAVKRDLARGEARFFRVWTEEKSLLAAPGIAGCRVPDVKTARTGPINQFDKQESHGSEVERQCRFAVHNYKVRYNQELAKQLGPSMGSNCSGKPGKIDPFDRPFDFEAYRMRMANVKHR